MSYHNSAISLRIIVPGICAYPWGWTCGFSDNFSWNFKSLGETANDWLGFVLLLGGKRNTAVIWEKEIPPMLALGGLFFRGSRHIHMHESGHVCSKQNISTNTHSSIHLYWTYIPPTLRHNEAFCKLAASAFVTPVLYGDGGGANARDLHLQKRDALA